MELLFAGLVIVGIVAAVIALLIGFSAFFGWVFMSAVCLLRSISIIMKNPAVRLCSRLQRGTNPAPTYDPPTPSVPEDKCWDGGTSSKHL